jgi:hypothetical protein
MRINESPGPTVRFAFTKSKIDGLPWPEEGQIFYR